MFGYDLGPGFNTPITNSPPILEHSGVSAGEIDPQWSERKVEAWKEWATENIEGVNYEGMGSDIGPANDREGFDYGIRPLLYDLNTRGYFTIGSNLASSGSSKIWVPFVNLAKGVEPPPDVYRELERRAPAGYIPYSGSEGYNKRGIYDIQYSHESCTNHNDMSTCSHRPSKKERAEVDAAFVRAVRAVL